MPWTASATGIAMCQKTVSSDGSAMSPSDYSETFSGVGEHVRFAPKSRHQKLDVRLSTENVRLALNSRRSGQVLRMSQIDPERKLIAPLSPSMDYMKLTRRLPSCARSMISGQCAQSLEVPTRISRLSKKVWIAGVLFLNRITWVILIRNTATTGMYPAIAYWQHYQSPLTKKYRRLT